jgi:hypothetical protein
MRFLRRFLARLKNFATGRRDDQRLREEMEEHLVQQTAENLRAGMVPAEARRQAVLKFGAVQAVRENYHAEQGLPLMENLLQDTRYALHKLARSPGFAAAAILAMALGIGATVGLVGALIVSHVMAGVLYGVRPTDPVTFAGVAILLIGIALLACYLPARRAMRVDPMVALRCE